MSIFTDITNWVQNLFTGSTNITPIIDAGDALVLELQTIITAVKNGQISTIGADATQFATDISAFASAIETFVTNGGTTPIPTATSVHGRYPFKDYLSDPLITFKTVITDGEKVLQDLVVDVAAIKSGLITNIVPYVLQTASDAVALVAAIESLIPTKPTPSK